MSKVQYGDIPKDVRYQMIGDFYDIVGHLKTKKDVTQFFMGLVTASEIIMFARRIQIAKLILIGRSYSQIQKELKVGLNTIKDVKKWMQRDGSGFRKEIEKLQNRQKKHTGDTKKMYDRILSPYGQLEILEDVLKGDF